jgi:hypothetical protein
LDIGCITYITFSYSEIFGSDLFRKNKPSCCATEKSISKKTEITFLFVVIVGIIKGWFMEFDFIQK